jgi:plasmid stabilization system protein ParE
MSSARYVRLTQASMRAHRPFGIGRRNHCDVISDVRPLAHFPYLVFYVVGDEAVDVWRILHTRRDIPTAMGDDSDA